MKITKLRHDRREHDPAIHHMLSVFSSFMIKKLASAESGFTKRRTQGLRRAVPDFGVGFLCRDEEDLGNGLWLNKDEMEFKKKVKGERAGEGLVVDVSRYWVRREAGSCDTCGISSGASGIVRAV